MRQLCDLIIQGGTIVNHDGEGLGDIAIAKGRIAAIGNVVSQLHLHHVVRFKEDPAWPAPVWGREKALPFSDEALAEMLWRLKMETLPGWTPLEIA